MVERAIAQLTQVIIKSNYPVEVLKKREIGSKKRDKNFFARYAHDTL